MTVKTPTTLVLGAASSLHCDYPLGAVLINDVVNMHENGELTPLPDQYAEDDVERLVTRLARSGYYSIDAFLEDAHEHTGLGKYLIASVLKRKENLSRLFPPYKSGWYQYLFNSLLGSETSPFSDNELSIVTFNYDRSIEAYLTNALMARFSMSPHEAAKELSHIPIYHVHGILGKFPEVPYEKDVTPNELYAISQSINIIHEIEDSRDEYCNEEFRQASGAANNSEKLIFLGFGYHFDNVRRLQIDWSQKSENNVYSTFYDTTPEEYSRVIDRLSSLGVTKERLPRRNGHDCNTFFRHTTSLV